MKKIALLVILLSILLLGILDAQNIDDLVYHYLNIGPLIYYDLPIWSFLQSLGVMVALIGIHLAYKTWNLETEPIVYATGCFFISLSEENGANIKRDRLIKEHQTFQLVNVGRSAANNVILSKEMSEVGGVLEDPCPHSFAIPSNQGTRQLGEVLRIHGDKKIFNDTNQLKLYIHFQDNRRKTHYTRVNLQRVVNADGEIGRVISNSVQMWKVMSNVGASTE